MWTRRQCSSAGNPICLLACFAFSARNTTQEYACNQSSPTCMGHVTCTTIYGFGLFDDAPCIAIHVLKVIGQCSMYSHTCQRPNYCATLIWSYVEWALLAMQALFIWFAVLVFCRTQETHALTLNKLTPQLHALFLSLDLLQDMLGRSVFDIVHSCGIL